MLDGEGRDCTEIIGVESVSCQSGHCVVRELLFFFHASLSLIAQMTDILGGLQSPVGLV